MRDTAQAVVVRVKALLGRVGRVLGGALLLSVVANSLDGRDVIGGVRLLKLGSARAVRHVG